MDCENSFRCLIRKVQYETEAAAYGRLPLLKRIFKRAPKDPFPEKTYKQMAEGVRASIEEAYFGKSGLSLLEDGQSIWCKVRRNGHAADAGWPVICITYCDGDCFWSERAGICRDGSVRQMPLEVPYDEYVKGVSDDAISRMPKGFLQVVRKYHRCVSDLSEAARKALRQ